MKVKLIYKDGSEEEYIRAYNFKSDCLFNNDCIQFYCEDEPIRILKSMIEKVEVYDFAY